MTDRSMHRALGLPALVMLLHCLTMTGAPGQGAALQASLRYWGVDATGSVRAVASAEDDLWLGGSFSALQPSIRTHGVFDTQTAALHPSSPGAIPSGNVTVVIPDGNGGWYVGGRFTSPGATPTIPEVRGVIKILPSGERDLAFDALMPDQAVFGAPVQTLVQDLVLSGNTLYIAGRFGSINGLSRAHVAAVNATTGSALAFDAGFTVSLIGSIPSEEVRNIELDGNSLYFHGFFQSVQGQTRASIAAVDAVSGTVLPWDPMPGPTGTPNDMVAANGVVWLGGSFPTIQGLPFPRLAAVDGVTGAPLPGFQATADSTVSRLSLSGTTLYVGGVFTQLNNIGRNGFGALDAASGSLLPWAPPLMTRTGQTQAPNRILATATRVYACGGFDTVGGQPRAGIVALDRATAQVQAWDPMLQRGGSFLWAQVNTMALDGSRLFLGGSFEVSPVSRDDLAVLDLRGGLPRGSSISVNGSVEALALSGDTTFVGGVFSNVGGQFRIGLAAVDRATGTTTSWNAMANGSVTGLLEVDGVLYCAGNFNSLGGQPRSTLGAVDTQTALATPFDPAPNGAVTGLDAEGGVLYVAGDFTQIGGQPRDRLAAFDLATGQLLPWNPGADGGVTALAVEEAEVFIGGNFTMVGGQARNGLANIDRVSGQTGLWNPPVSNNSGPVLIEAIAVEGPRIWIGGLFTTVTGFPRANLAEIDRATNLATPWSPAPNALVSVVERVGRRLVIGGQFTQIGSSGSTRGIAVFPLIDMATVGIVAPACSNASLAPRLRSSRPVMPGGHVYFLDRTTPMSTGALFVSFEPPIGTPLLALPGGCFSGLDLPSLALLANFTTDANGMWQFPIPLPTLPGLLNLPIRANAIVNVTGGAISGAFDITETLELTIGS